MVGIILTSVLTFFAQAIITKIIVGDEDLVYYRHEIAVLSMSALFLWIMRQPILPYLDATLLGVGIFLACGRVGCLMVGCCHGRPYHWGVCYREEHAAAGFAPYYVGVRLFPSQAVESLWALCIVLVGSVFVLSGSPAGTALAWYVVMYDTGRFYFEFARGDVDRPYLRGFSEAQWVSMLLMCLVVVAESFGVLHFQFWHVLATLCVAGTMVAVALKRRFQNTPKHRLLHPSHVKEFAEVLQRVANPVSNGVQVGCTSLGIRVSVGEIRGEQGVVWHYGLSQLDGEMTEEVAKIMGRLIVQLRHYSGGRLMRGKQGVFHLLVDVVQEDEMNILQASPYVAGIRVV